MKSLISYLVALATVLLATSALAFAQSTRNIDLGKPLENEPVQLAGISYNGRSLLGNPSFSADSDWLRNLTFTVKNVSDKNIVNFILNLEVEKEGLPIDLKSVSGIFGMPIGILPDEIYEKRKKVLAPGEEVKISIDPYTINRLDQHLKQTGSGEISRAKLLFNFILFEDKTGWNQGKVLVQDSRNPKMWIEKKN